MKKEKQKRSGKEMLLIVLLLTIGFAAVTTTLYINGTINIGANQEDFDKNLKFTAAKLEYSEKAKDTAKADVTTGLIVENGKKISFTVLPLKTIGETATLTYEISNLSQYDANLAEISCRAYKGTDNTGTEVTNAVVNAKTGEYIKLETSNVAGLLTAGGVKSGNTLTVTMIKSFVGTPASEGVPASDTASYYITCDINADGQSAPTTTATTTTTTTAATGA